MSWNQRLLAGALAWLVAGAGTAAAAGDSVNTHFQARGVDFDIDEEGDFKLLETYEDSGRKQVVYVRGAPETVAGSKVRRITSPAARVGTDGIDDRMVWSLMGRNAESRLGAWSIGGSWLMFEVILSDDMTADELMAAIDYVARTADGAEQTFSGDLDHF